MNPPLHGTEDCLVMGSEEMHIKPAKRRHQSQHPSPIARDRQHSDITASVELKPVILRLCYSSSHQTPGSSHWHRTCPSSSLSITSPPPSHRHVSPDSPIQERFPGPDVYAQSVRNDLPDQQVRLGIHHHGTVTSSACVFHADHRRSLVIHLRPCVNRASNEHE